MRFNEIKKEIEKHLPKFGRVRELEIKGGGNFTLDRTEGD